MLLARKRSTLWRHQKPPPQPSVCNTTFGSGREQEAFCSKVLQTDETKIELFDHNHKMYGWQKKREAFEGGKKTPSKSLNIAVDLMLRGYVAARGMEGTDLSHSTHFDLSQHETHRCN